MEALGSAARRALAVAGPATVSIGRDGRGSGLVVAAGLVLTNAHNLRDRTTTVTFADGRAEQGRAAGVDPDGDLALLGVDTATTGSLGWSGAALEPGDVVFALSRGPRGVRVSFGLVSAVDRAFRGPRGRLVHGSIEHSAPLARGSSGGPLLDSAGQLVGVNTHRFGDGFYLALAADADLRARVDALAVGDAPDRPRLGIAVAPAHVARRLRRAVGLPDRDGLLVRAVDASGPAAQAGVRPGDLVVAVGGRAVTTADELHNVMESGPSSPLVVTVVRGVDEIALTADLT
ncbi:MAG: S1C family serine protease [Acidimicrobiia bacterium]